MPIYEYYCFDCRSRVSVFYRTISSAEGAEPACPTCKGSRVRRLVSRVTVVRSEEDRMDALADPAMLAGLDEEDPRTLGKLMRQMSDELGEDVDDPEFGEVIERLESGQTPDEIEKALPETNGSEAGIAAGDI